MRITNKMISDNMLSVISSNRSLAAELQLDIATTKKVRRPSDDPGAVAQIQKFKSLMSRNEQFSKNISQATGFMTSAASALDAIFEDLQTAKDIATQGGSDSINTEGRQALAQNIDQIISNLVDLGNSKYRDRFLFAGNLTIGSAPFSRSGDTVAYNGNDEELKTKTGFESEITYNRSGTDIFNRAGGVDIFSTLAALKQGLENDDTNAIQNSIDALGSSIQQVLRASADFGVLQQRVSSVEQMIESENINLADFISKIQDTDMIEAIINFQNLENAVTVGLQSMAQIIRLSLVDFVR